MKNIIYMLTNLCLVLENPTFKCKKSHRLRIYEKILISVGVKSFILAKWYQSFLTARSKQGSSPVSDKFFFFII